MWNVYMPPEYLSGPAPPFNASTWTLADSYDDSDGKNDCAGASLALQKQYWNEGDMAKSKRALQAICVNQETGETTQQ
jgi:hypothetical protein